MRMVKGSTNGHRVIKFNEAPSSVFVVKRNSVEVFVMPRAHDNQIISFDTFFVSVLNIRNLVFGVNINGFQCHEKNKNLDDS